MKFVILAVEVLIVFSLGVIGNKIAEILKIEPLAIVIATIFLLILTIIVTAIRTRASHISQVAGTPDGTPNPSAFPTTIAGMVPVGILLGLSAAAVVGLTVGQVPKPVGTLPFSVFGIYVDDVVTSLLGLAIVLVFALTLQPVLSSGISFGFGIGAPTALLLTAHDGHDVDATLVGYIIEFTLVSLLIARNSKTLKRLSAVIHAPRS